MLKPVVEKEMGHFKITCPSKRVAKTIFETVTEMGWNTEIDAVNLLIFPLSLPNNPNDIEEKNIENAIKSCANHLIHVQLSENDRGTLGKGHIDFESIIKTLVDINYQGMVSIEAFSMKLAAANIWRPMFESEYQLMADSIAYLKKLGL
jgi:D-psicose/D-tagatose/L-ribulose 3-epimerase